MILRTTPRPKWVNVLPGHVRVGEKMRLSGGEVVKVKRVERMSCTVVIHYKTKFWKMEHYVQPTKTEMVEVLR